MTVLAQSSNVTIQPGVSIPAHLLEGPVPGAYITGYIFDEDGHTVSGATVSLWQDGQMWQIGNYQYPSSDNPQKTDPAYSGKGFVFGYVYPGDYTLTAEKDGYEGGPVSVHVGNETLSPNQLESVTHPIMMNITLSGYHVPTLTPGQQSYAGAITGNLMTASGMKVTGINMSLWQDGQMVKRPDNPQSSFERNFSGANVEYLFDHLAPGHYTVMAEYSAGGEYNDTVTLDVGTSPMRVDIVLSQLFGRPYNFPVNSFTPTVVEFTASSPSATVLPSTALASEPRPTPALPWISVLLIIGITACFMYEKYDRP